MRDLDIIFRPARFRYILILFFAAVSLSVTDVHAQEISELNVFVQVNGFSSSDHFSDLVYGGLGTIEIIDGKISDSDQIEPKTLLVNSSNQNLLEEALQRFKSIELVRINMESSGDNFSGSGLSEASNLKYVLFLIPDSISPSMLADMVGRLSIDPRVVILYQISRPG